MDEMKLRKTKEIISFFINSFKYLLRGATLYSKEYLIKLLFPRKSDVKNKNGKW